MGEPTLGESFGSALGFFGDALFTWVPSVLITVFKTVRTPPPAAVRAELAEPISASEFPGFIEQVSTPAIYDSITNGWAFFVLLAISVSLPFLATVVYCWIRVYVLRQHEERMFEAAQRPVVSKDVPRTQLRWTRILEQVSSDSEQHWRLAILEADIMLNDLLDVQGYKGETMADKMKQVDRGNFNSIDAAWEAHRIRNRIAHDGADHTLTHREARRIIGLYERIFREFHYIE